jgi:hypothetical protein
MVWRGAPEAIEYPRQGSYQHLRLHPSADDTEATAEPGQSRGLAPGGATLTVTSGVRRSHRSVSTTSTETPPRRPVSAPSLLARAHRTATRSPSTARARPGTVTAAAIGLTSASFTIQTL